MVHPLPRRLLSQAERLYKLTRSFAESAKPRVTAPSGLRLTIEQVMANAAYCGVFRKYLMKEAESKVRRTPPHAAPRTAAAPSRRASDLVSRHLTRTPPASTRMHHLPRRSHLSSSQDSVEIPLRSPSRSPRPLIPSAHSHPRAL